MSPRPPIFISAVSRELRSARQLVANTLTFLGYEPVWQEIFGTESGDLRAILRQQIDQCKGVVQVVGQCYGAEPPTPDAQLGRVSYTQYEALYARERGKKVWYLFIDETFPINAHEREPDELRGLQAAYRSRLQSDTHVFHPLTSNEALEASVLKLRDDLTRLRRGAKRWAGGVAVMLIVIASLVIWLVRGQSEAARKMQETEKTLNTVSIEITKLRQGIMEYAQIDAQISGVNKRKSETEIQELIYAELGNRLHVDPKILREKLPQFAEELRRAPDASTYEKANAALVAGHYQEAEHLFRSVIEELTRVLGPGHPDTLAGRAKLVYALARQTKYADAETEAREVSRLRGIVLGPEHVDTLNSRYFLADALIRQGEYAEAESLYREMIPVIERVLGIEDPLTLHARLGLATALGVQDKNLEAEALYREVIKLDEKVCGPEHEDTWVARQNLATTLQAEHKYPEAEAEYRDVIKIAQKVVGPEHPDTLITRNNLAELLDDEGNFAEAEAECRQIIGLEEKTLGPESLVTLNGRGNLAVALIGLSKFADAEVQYKDVLKLMERVLGFEHPDTLAYTTKCATGLSRQNKIEEAMEIARGGEERARKLLGPDNPSTLKYTKLVQDLEAKR